jgi:hypothetical protein
MQKEWKKARHFYHKAFEFQKEKYTYPLMAALCLKRAGDEKQLEQYLKGIIDTIPRDDLAYHMGRTLLDPGYDRNFTYRLEEEKEKKYKYRILFYLATYYYLENKITLAQTYFLEVRDNLDPTFMEHRLAQWELTQMGEGIR